MVSIMVEMQAEMEENIKKTPKKNNLCHICDKNFRDSWKLKRHIKSCEAGRAKPTKTPKPEIIEAWITL